MKYLNINNLKSREGFNTAREICGQPKLWIEIYLKLIEEKEQISRFLSKILQKDSLNIILTGAGSSAFIGEALAGTFQRNFAVPARAIATTNIISHPEDYFMRAKSTLMISFARSGDSPESLAAAEIANQYCDVLYEFVITCNPKGKLVKRNCIENCFVFLLPEGANDIALAMTGSFTSMLLAGLLISDIQNIESKLPIIHKLENFGNYILNECLLELKKIADMKFERVVFLGSGPLLGAAQESHLKVQELTDGKVICKFDSYLGFRHGPMAVVDESTIIFYLFSNNDYVRQYEADLVKSINKISKGTKYVGIGDNVKSEEYKLDLTIQFSNGTTEIPEEFLSVFYVLPAQILGFYKSLNLGLSPDSPSIDGSISRVVQGVKIYPNTAI
jgi:tagatose-6-phosphate ketose/aldose isomerase